MAEIINVLSDFATVAANNNVSAEIILKIADPSLGTFAIAQGNIPSSVTVTLSSLGDSVTFSSANATELTSAVKEGYAFSVSSEAAARGLTSGIFVEVVAKETSQNQEGQTSIAMNQLRINEGPSPHYTPTMAATFNVTRGKRFVLDLNSTFVQPQGLSMSFAGGLSGGYSGFD